MINMISLNTFDALGKPNRSTDDPQDPDLATDLFASFFVVPVSMPPVNMPVADQPQDAKPETGTSVNAVELQIISPQVGPKDPTLVLETNIAGTESLLGSGEEKTSAAVFSQPAFTDSQPISLIPEDTDAQSVETKLINPLDLPADSNADAGVEETALIAPTAISGATPLPTEFSQRPILEELASPIQPDIEPASLSEVSQQETPSLSDAGPTPVADVKVSNPIIRQPDLSYEPPMTKLTLPFQLSDETPVPTLLLPQHVLSGPGQEEIMVELPKEADVNIKENYIVPKPLTPPFFAGVSKIFKDVSSIVRDDNSLKANIGSNTPSEQVIVDLAKQNFAGDSNNTLDRSATEPLIPDEKVKITDGGVETIFSASLNEAVKTLNLPYGPATETIAREKIMEQVEPRMMELAAAVHSDGEKRVLKIRLTPPELGTVEVTLQKNASGRIDAHFQAESHETRHVLNEGLLQLRASLEKSGMHVGDLDTSFGSFSPTGNENRRDQSHKFGTTEVLSADTINFDGISKDEDDADGRLVNLRA